MTIILEPNSFILNTLGQQKNIDRNFYRKFTYTFLLKKENKFLFYNMLTREMLSLTEDEYMSVFTNEYNNTTFYEYLIQNWFLVPENTDDKKVVEQLRTILSLIENNNKKSFDFFMILPTTDCNARCFYCYEANIEKKKMSTKTAKDVITFIANKSNNKKINISWFGGEPLYNIEAIDIISLGLRERNIDFSSTMISNGYLFSQETILRAKNQWNLTTVQITLDGTEEVYNRCKNYIYSNGRSPYKVVINNIKSIISMGIFVSIRLNLDTHNFEDLKILIEELHSTLGDNSNYGIYVHLLFEDSGNLKLNYNQKEKELRFGQLFELEDIIKEKGLFARKKLSNKPKTHMCMADDDSSIIILPDGKLSKCEHSLYKETVGNIYDDALDSKIISTWKKRIPELEKCKFCPIYPDCIKLNKCINEERTCEDLQQSAAIKNFEYIIWNKFVDKTENNRDRKIGEDSFC